MNNKSIAIGGKRQGERYLSQLLHHSGFPAVSLCVRVYAPLRKFAVAARGWDIYLPLGQRTTHVINSTNVLHIMHR